MLELNIDQQRLYAILKRVLQRHASEIEALNKSQLSEGLRSDDTPLPAYSKGYLKTRRKHGRPIAPMDLNLTGESYKQWFTTFFESYMNIGSTSGKLAIQELRFGSEIYGLNEENLNIVRELVMDEFVEEFIKDTFG